MEGDKDQVWGVGSTPCPDKSKDQVIRNDFLLLVGWMNSDCQQSCVHVVDRGQASLLKGAYKITRNESTTITTPPSRVLKIKRPAPVLGFIFKYYLILGPNSMIDDCDNGHPLSHHRHREGKGSSRWSGKRMQQQCSWGTTLQRTISWTLLLTPWSLFGFSQSGSHNIRDPLSTGRYVMKSATGNVIIYCLLKCEL